MIEAMRQKGVRMIDGLDKWNQTPLICAVRCDNKKAVTKLLAAGANIDHVGSNGLSALHIATWHDAAWVVDSLIKHNACSTLLTPSGDTALRLARQRGHKYSALKKNARVVEYSRELRQRKLIAHISGVAGTTTLAHPDRDQAAAVTVSVNGCYHKETWHIINKRIKLFFQKDSIIPAACKGAAKDYYNSSTLVRRYLQEDMPIIVNTGYSGRYISAILWRTYFILCDRNYEGNSCQVLQLNPQDVDEYFIMKLRTLEKNSREEYIDFIHKTFPSHHIPHPVDSEEALLERFLLLPVDQHGTNTELAVYALLVIEEIMKCPKGIFPTVEELAHIANMQRQVFENWQAFMLETQIERYVRNRNHKSTAADQYPHDWELLERVKQVAPKAVADKIDQLRARANDELVAVEVNKAIRFYQHDRALQLLSGRVALDYVDADGNTVLHNAVYGGNKKIVKATIASMQRTGISLDIPNKNGDGPLIVASNRGHHRIAKALVKAGVDMSHLSYNGCSALYDAAHNGHARVIEVLAPAMLLKGLSLDDDHCLIIASQKGHLAAVRALLAEGAAVDHLNEAGGWPALFYAAEHNRNEVAKLLISVGAKVARVDDKGYTALLVSRKKGYKELYTWMKKQDERVYEYSRELRQRKLLAHMLSINEKTRLLHPDKNAQQHVDVNLKGWNCNDIWKIISKRGQSFFKDHSVIKRACQLVADDASSYKLAFAYRLNQPIIINIGYIRHHVAAILWGPYFIICNRGNASHRASCEVLPLNSKKVDPYFIAELRNLENKTAEEYEKYLNEKFPERLSAAPQGSARALLEHYLSLSMQEMGNCAWANSEAAIYALLFLIEFMRYPTDQLPTQDKLEQIALMQKQIFASFREFMIDTQVERYLRGPKTDTSASYLYPRDWDLLNHVKAKAPAFVAAKIDQFNVAARDMMKALELIKK